MKILSCGENLPRDAESIREQGITIKVINSTGVAECEECKSRLEVGGYEFLNTIGNAIKCPLCENLISVTDVKWHKK